MSQHTPEMYDHAPQGTYVVQSWSKDCEEENESA